MKTILLILSCLCAVAVAEDKLQLTGAADGLSLSDWSLENQVTLVVGGTSVVRLGEKELVIYLQKGEVRISRETGIISFNGEVNLDEAARRFWQALAQQVRR